MKNTCKTQNIRQLKPIRTPENLIFDIHRGIYTDIEEIRHKKKSPKINSNSFKYFFIF